MEYWTPFRIGLLILLILVFVTGIPLVTWCVLQIRKDWNRAYITKRHRIMVIGSLVLGSTFEFSYVIYILYFIYSFSIYINILIYI